MFSIDFSIGLHRFTISFCFFFLFLFFFFFCLVLLTILMQSHAFPLVFARFPKGKPCGSGRFQVTLAEKQPMDGYYYLAFGDALADIQVNLSATWLI